MSGGLAATRPAIVDLVFGTAPRAPKRRRVPPALAFAALIHLALVVWALGSRPSLESWGAEIAARVHAELTHVEMVEIEPAPPPPAAPPEEATPEPPEPPPTVEEVAPEPAPSRAEPRPAARAPAPAPRSAEPPPARAGEVLAAEGGAVDLTDAFTQGEGPTYAGGVTTSRGGGSSAGGRGDGAAPARPQAPAPAPAPAKRSADDRSAPVSLAPERWSCPWPREAIDADLDEAYVILRVAVDRRGRAARGEIVADPGDHFGEAALACALKTQFTPARDRNGAAIEAWSPPIRVRFYR